MMHRGPLGLITQGRAYIFFNVRGKDHLSHGWFSRLRQSKVAFCQKIAIVGKDANQCTAGEIACEGHAILMLNGEGISCFYRSN